MIPTGQPYNTILSIASPISRFWFVMLDTLLREVGYDATHDAWGSECCLALKYVSFMLTVCRRVVCVLCPPGGYPYIDRTAD